MAAKTNSKPNRKKSRRQNQSNNTAIYSEPPKVLRVAAEVATVQEEIRQHRMALARAEAAVIKAESHVDFVKDRLTTAMLNHREAVGRLTEASGLQIQVP